MIFYNKISNNRLFNKGIEAPNILNSKFDYKEN